MLIRINQYLTAGVTMNDYVSSLLPNNLPLYNVIALGLMEAGVSGQDLDDALNSRISDLQDTINVKELFKCQD